VARVLRAGGGRIREDYLEECGRFAELYGHLEPQLWDVVRDLVAGKDVVVQHGWEINMAPDSGPWLLRADGRLE
jgi:hypothetical protein